MSNKGSTVGPRVLVQFIFLLGLRHAANLTQEELAAHAGIAAITVRRAERGERISLEMARAICSVLKADLNEVAEIEEDPIAQHQYPFLADKPGPKSEQLLFHKMLEELGKQVSDDVAKDVMNKMFDQMRFFPMGESAAKRLGRVKTYDLDGFLAILKFRALSIVSHLDGIIKGNRPLLDPAAKKPNAILSRPKSTKLANSWKERFMALHEQHVQAILNGQLLVAHELRSEISNLLATIATRVYSPPAKSKKHDTYFFPRSSH
jgi:transcriptional regulator with XRE-family HTH domain